MFDPMADLATGKTIEFEVPAEEPWTPYFGDNTAPYMPAWALECSVCGNTGFVTGGISEATATLHRSGWQVFSTRVLCPPCVRDDA
jgi:hypothetical protein